MFGVGCVHASISFNGATLIQRGIQVDIREIETEANVASMGPRLFSVEYLAALRTGGESKTGLQWGHAYSAWNTPSARKCDISNYVSFNGATLIQRGIHLQLPSDPVPSPRFNGATLIQRGIQ